MYSLVSAAASAIINLLLVLFGVIAWWLGLILFFVGWFVIWALARLGIEGDSLSDLGDAFMDTGDGGGSHYDHGGWGGGSCGGSGGGGGD